MDITFSKITDMSRSEDSHIKKSYSIKLHELLPQCYGAVKGENICYPKETSCSEGKKHRYQPVRITQVYNGLMSVESNRKRNASTQKMPIRNLHKLLASPKRNIRRRLDNAYDPPKESAYKSANQAAANSQRNDKIGFDKMISDNKSISVKQSTNGTNRDSQCSRKSYLPMNAMRKINDAVGSNENSKKIVSNDRISTNRLLGPKQSVGGRKSYLPVKTAKDASRHTLCSTVARSHIQTMSVINDAQEKHFKEFDVVKGSSVNVSDQGKNMKRDGTCARTNDNDIQANTISSQAFLLGNKNSLLHLEDINDQLTSSPNLISLDSYICVTQSEHDCSIDDAKLDISSNNENCEATSIVTQLQKPFIGTESPVTVVNSTEMSQMPTICVTETSDILEFDTVKLDQLSLTCPKKTDTTLASPNNVHTTGNINSILCTEHSDIVNLPISNVHSLESLCIDLENTNISILNDEHQGTNLKHLSCQVNPKINENRQSLIVLESNLKSSICVHEKELSRLKLLLTFVQNMLRPNVTAVSKINLWKSTEEIEQLSIQQIECTSTAEEEKVETPPKMDLLSKVIQTKALIGENVRQENDKDERNNSEVLEKVAFQSTTSNIVDNFIEETHAKEDKDDEEEKENFKTPSKREKNNKTDCQEKCQQKRRSARLAAKQVQSPQIDDSFVTLEKTLNITHAQSKPCTPYLLRTPRRERNWERESGKKSERPLREYMNLKSTTKFLETPDVNRFQRRLNEDDTPLHSRTITSFLSNKLLTQLVDLHGESPEYVSTEEQNEQKLL